MFLLAGPATNIASLTVLTGVLGKRATAIYLTAIAVSAVVFGLVVDQVYISLGLSAQAMVGQASEIVPLWAGLIGALVIALISAKPIFSAIRARVKPVKQASPVVQIQDKIEIMPAAEPCECGPT